MTDSAIRRSPLAGWPHGRETPPWPEHSTGQHSMPTNENQGRPSSIAAWRISRGVRGENVVDADGSAAFLEGLERVCEDIELVKDAVREEVADKAYSAESTRALE